MKARFLRLLRIVAIFVYRLPMVKQWYEAILKSLIAPVKARVRYKEFGVFKKDDGDEVTLLKGLRSDIKPNWESMVDSPKNNELPSEEVLTRKANVCRQNVNDLVLFLEAYGIELRGKSLLEIGCYDGIHAYQLSKLTGKVVIASDISRYYIVQQQGSTLNESSIAYQGASLNELRDHCISWMDESSSCVGKVDFIEDDISKTTLPDACVDIICSWEVLEHIAEPEEAFKNMYRLLKPSGICFHEYNPFFSIDGGHSLCTLDFHWGHTRLSDNEFDRYVDDLRPEENQIDKAFFHQSLNRMTLSLLKKYAESAGFTVKEIIPWVNEYHAELVENDVLIQTQSEHPTAAILDLISPKVWVVLQK